MGVNPNIFLTGPTEVCHCNPGQSLRPELLRDVTNAFLSFAILLTNTKIALRTILGRQDQGPQESSILFLYLVSPKILFPPSFSRSPLLLHYAFHFYQSSPDKYILPQSLPSLLFSSSSSSTFSTPVLHRRTTNQPSITHCSQSVYRVSIYPPRLITQRTVFCRDSPLNIPRNCAGVRGAGCCLFAIHLK